MKTLTPLQGLLFDFDGLIVDTETATFAAWQEIYQEHGLVLDLQTYAEYVGKSGQEWGPFEELVRLLGERYRAAIQEKISRWEADLFKMTEAMPGVRTLVNQAWRRGIKLGIVSSSGQSWIERHLQRLGLRKFFSSITSADEVEHAKPDPCLYHLGLSKLDIPKERVIVFEDSPNGVLAAKRARLYCIAVPNQLTRQFAFHTNGGCPDKIINSLLDFNLVDYLGKGI